MIRCEYCGGMTTSEIEDYFYEKGKELMSKSDDLCEPNNKELIVCGFSATPPF